MARQLPRRRSSARPPEDDYGYDDDYKDDEEQEEKRTRARRRSRDDEDDERPAPRRSRSRRDDDDDEDERPTRSSRGGSRRSSDREDEKRSASVGRGWDTYKDERAKKAAGNAHRLQVKDKEVIIKFLEDEPFAVYQQHWIGQRSYSCPGEKCPLCDRGHDTRYLALFNVVDMKSGDNLFWEAGPNAAKKIQEKAEKKQTSPINRDDLYFAVNRTKQSNGFFEFSLTPIKERDMEDEWETPPLTDEELDEALDNLFDESVIRYDSPRDLRAVAEGDDDDE